MHVFKISPATARTESGVLLVMTDGALQCVPQYHCGNSWY